jgi:hypothetical protein
MLLLDDCRVSILVVAAAFVLCRIPFKAIQKPLPAAFGLGGDTAGTQKNILLKHSAYEMS